MANFWAAVLGSLIGGGLLSFVVRSLFSQLLSLDLEEFKARLERENATAIERFRADLQAHGFRGERLHELRIRLMLRVYAQLYETIQAMHRALYSETDDPDVRAEAREAVNRLQRRLAKGFPFLSRPLAERLKQVRGRLSRAYLRIEWDKGTRGEHRRAAIELLEVELGTILGALDDELRAFMEGVPPER